MRRGAAARHIKATPSCLLSEYSCTSACTPPRAFFVRNCSIKDRAVAAAARFVSAGKLASLSNNGTQPGSGTRAAALTAARPRSFGRMAGGQRGKGKGERKRGGEGNRVVVGLDLGVVWII